MSLCWEVWGGGIWIKYGHISLSNIFVRIHDGMCILEPYTRCVRRLMGAVALRAHSTPRSIVSFPSHFL